MTGSPSALNAKEVSPFGYLEGIIFPSTLSWKYGVDGSTVEWYTPLTQARALFSLARRLGHSRRLSWRAMLSEMSLVFFQSIRIQCVATGPSPKRLSKWAERYVTPSASSFADAERIGLALSSAGKCFSTSGEICFTSELSARALVAIAATTVDKIAAQKMMFFMVDDIYCKM